jgi:hypothetical protein
MSDEADRPEFLTGRERRLANLRPFQKGNTFGKGRPKDLARFGDILMGEFYKTILASLAGKTVNKTQGEMVALEIVQLLTRRHTVRKLATRSRSSTLGIPGWDALFAFMR